METHLFGQTWIAATQPLESASLRMLVSLPDSLLPQPGKIYLTDGKLRLYPPPAHPQLPDLRPYFRQLGLYEELKVQNLYPLGAIPVHLPWYKKAGITIQKACEQGPFSFEESGLLIATLIGDKTGISQETKQQFRTAGTLHILAVSGMHVGILYLILHTLTHWLLWRNKGRWVKYILVIGCLWAFCLITGASASVLRSVWMFSLFHTGKLLYFKQNSINTLFATALVMLSVNPQLIFDLGFQLSFLAVGGILFFYPLFQHFYKHTWKPLRWIADSAAISLAAQLATAPVILSNFGSFPTWFLFNNLVAVPLSSAALPLGLAWLTFSQVPYLGSALGWLLSKLLWMLLLFTGWMSGWPRSTITNISVSLWETGGLLLAGIFGCYFFHSQSWKYLRPILIISTIVLLIPVTRYLINPQPTRWIGYRDNQLEFGENQTIRYTYPADSLAAASPVCILWENQHFLLGHPGMVSRESDTLRIQLYADSTADISIWGESGPDTHVLTQDGYW